MACFLEARRKVEVAESRAFRSLFINQERNALYYRYWTANALLTRVGLAMPLRVAVKVLPLPVLLPLMAILLNVAVPPITPTEVVEPVWIASLPAGLKLTLNVNTTLLALDVRLPNWSSTNTIIAGEMVVPRVIELGGC
jgi:hypothetical protein